MDEVLYFFFWLRQHNVGQDVRCLQTCKRMAAILLNFFFLLQVLQQLSEGMSSYNAVGFEVSHSVHFGRPTGIPGCLSLQCHVFQ